MYAESIQLVVNRKAYSQEIAKAAFVAAFGREPETAHLEMRTQATELMEDGDSIRVTLVHEDLFDPALLSYFIDSGQHEELVATNCTCAAHTETANS